MLIDRRFRLPRVWSNAELRKIAPLFRGEVVNISAWEDRDKEGHFYRDYFTGASAYHVTNYSGARGFQGKENEHFLDLTADLPPELEGRFDVAFNHTTLEHIFEVRKAFQNICRTSRDVVIVVVPFSQSQHETDTWKDYWRFTPTCMRMLFAENGFGVVYEAQNEHRNAGTYLLVVGSRSPETWRGVLPAYEPIREAGAGIGASPMKRVRAEIGRIWSQLKPASAA